MQLHSVGAYERDSGDKSMEQLEAIFTGALGDMTKYNPIALAQALNTPTQV